MLGSRHGVQRAPARAGGAAPKAGAAPAKPASYDSYVDLFNAFQELGVAYVNRGGSGLDAVPFGKDLTRAHRSLLFDLRIVLKGAVDDDPDAKSKARSSWPSVARRIQTALGEARTAGLPSGPLAAFADTLAIFNKRLARTKAQRESTEAESADSYAEAVRAIDKLLIEFTWGSVKAGPGFIREEAPGRKDVEVNAYLKETNAKIRGQLAAVSIGPKAIGRHRALVESIRTTLIMARSEKAGSAHGAVVRWRRLPGEIEYVLTRAQPHLGMYDPAPILARVQQVGGMLTEQWQLVHQDNLGVVLTKERKPGELKAQKKVAKDLGAMGAPITEMIAVEDMQNALDVIQNHLKPSDRNPGEWVIKMGGQELRIHDWQAKGLHEAARGALAKYTQELYSALLRAQVDYEDIKRGTSKFKRNVLGFFGGADDHGGFNTEIQRLGIWKEQAAKPLIDAGKYVEVFKQILQEKPGVEKRVRAHAEYDADLDKGYKRLATTMSVVQVALVSLIPIAGEAALATAPAWAVGVTAVGAGAGGAFVGEGTRQVATGDFDAGKLGSRTWQGAVMGTSAIAPVATRSLGGGIAKNLGTSQAFGEYSASMVIGGTQSTLAGGSVTEGVVGGGLGYMGGRATTVLPKSSQAVTGRFAQAGVGAGVAELTNQDPLAGAVGSLVGSYAKAPPPKSATGGGGGSTTTPAPDAAPAPVTGADTLPGVGPSPRPPASPAPGADPVAPVTGADTLPGVGPSPRPPASPAPGGAKPPGGPPSPGLDQTQAGLGFDGRKPATQTGDTSPGMPAPGGPRRPAGQIDAVPDQTLAGGGFDGRKPAGTPGPAAPPTKWAKLPEYAGHKPLWEDARVVATIEDPVKAAQLYDRVYREGQRDILQTTHPDATEVVWVQDAGMGKGNAPAAWVREDGSVRFNLGKFKRPDFSDLHPTVAFTPKPLTGPIAPSRPLMYEDLVRPIPGGAKPRPQGFFKLADYAGRPPLFGPDSRVAHVITDPAEASALYTRVKAQAGDTSISKTTHEDATLVSWNQIDGQGPPPAAWIRTDGVVHFNFKHIDHPDAAWARQYVASQQVAPAPGSGSGPGFLGPGSSGPGGLPPPAGPVGGGPGSGGHGPASDGGGPVARSETIQGTGIAPKAPALPGRDPSAPLVGTQDSVARPGSGGTRAEGVDPLAPTGAGEPVPGGRQAGPGTRDVDPVGATGEPGTGGRPRSAGSARTERPVIAVDNTAPAPVGSAVATGKLAPGAAPVVRGGSSKPKGRPLEESAKLPQDLPEATNKVYDYDELQANQHHAGHDAKLDLPGGKPAASSRPTADFPAEEIGRYVKSGEKPVAGISAEESFVVVDTKDKNRKHLFKPIDAEEPVARAEERGIRAQEQAPREVAAPMVAKELNVSAAKGRLATIDGKKGVLIEWKEQNTLRDLAIADPKGFKKLIESEAFREAMTSMDALDYLINNLDRGTNFGNYLYEFQGNTLKLTAIDHGLTFTSTTERADIYGYTRQLPERYPPDLVKKLEQLEQTRAAFGEKIRPFVGDAAVEAFDQRLTIMLNDMRAKQAAGAAGGSQP